MDKKTVQKLEIGFYLAFFVIIIICATFREITYNTIITKALLVQFLFLFGVIHLKKFNAYKYENFAKQYRFLWVLFELASFLIIPQSLLLLFGLLFKQTFILEVFCLVGDFIIDMIIENPKDNEASDWASFLFILQYFSKLFQWFLVLYFI